MAGLSIKQDRTALEKSPSPPGSRYTAAQFITAIKGSAGVKSVIARRIGCTRETVVKWISKYPTVADAYNEERMKVLDMAESVVYANIQAAAALQEMSQYRAVVDSTDAKWLLTQVGADRGFGARAVLEGADGGAIEIVVRYDSRESSAVAKADAGDGLPPVATNGNGHV